MSGTQIKIPRSFYEFAQHIHEDSWACATLDDLARQGLNGIPADLVEEFLEFVQSIENIQEETLDLEDLWNRSPSAVFMSGQEAVLKFLQLAAHIAKTEGTYFDEIATGDKVLFSRKVCSVSPNTVSEDVKQSALRAKAPENITVDKSLRDLIASVGLQNNLIALENKTYVPSLIFIRAMGWFGEIKPVNEWMLNRTTPDRLTGYVLVEYGENEYLAVWFGEAFDPNIKYRIECLDGKINVTEKPIL